MFRDPIIWGLLVGILFLAYLLVSILLVMLSKKEGV